RHDVRSLPNLVPTIQTQRLALGADTPFEVRFPDKRRHRSNLHIGSARFRLSHLRETLSMSQNKSRRPIRIGGPGFTELRSYPSESIASLNSRSCFSPTNFCATCPSLNRITVGIALIWY